MKVLQSIQSVPGIVCFLANDALAFFRSMLRWRAALIAENLFLRKQLAFYQEHQAKPRLAFFHPCADVRWDDRRTDNEDTTIRDGCLCFC